MAVAAGLAEAAASVDNVQAVADVKTDAVTTESHGVASSVAGVAHTVGHDLDHGAHSVFDETEKLLKEAEETSGKLFEDAKQGTEKLVADQKKGSAKAWPFYVTALAGLLGFVSLFLPALTIKSLDTSVSFMSAVGFDIYGLSIFIMGLLMLAVIASSVIYLVTHRAWVKMITGVLAILGGTWAAMSAVVNWMQAGKVQSEIGETAVPDLGLYLLLASGVVLVLLGIVALLTKSAPSVKKSKAKTR